MAMAGDIVNGQCTPIEIMETHCGLEGHGSHWASYIDPGLKVSFRVCKRGSVTERQPIN